MSKSVFDVIPDDKRNEISERYWSYVDKSAGQSKCWPWIGHKDRFGYGKFGVKGRAGMPAHRTAYELVMGEIPDGLEIDHLCRRRDCCNPVHLEPVTHTENVRRAAMAITSCPSGHPYNEENTYIYRRPGGDWRFCRACNRDANAKYIAKKRSRTGSQSTGR